VCGREGVLAARERVGEVACDDRLLAAAVAVAAATRGHAGVELGASPRASLMLVRACRSLALVRGRDYVIDQDLVDLAPPVLAHRLRLKDARLDPDALVREIALAELARTPY
jgi:MoxR-like ATPase